MLLALYEMQTASSGIRILVTVSISITMTLTLRASLCLGRIISTLNLLTKHLKDGQAYSEAVVIYVIFKQWWII